MEENGLRRRAGCLIAGMAVIQSQTRQRTKPKPNEDTIQIKEKQKKRPECPLLAMAVMGARK